MHLKQKATEETVSLKMGGFLFLLHQNQRQIYPLQCINHLNEPFISVFTKRKRNRLILAHGRGKAKLLCSNFPINQVSSEEMYRNFNL